jgi:hypothetical protein
MNEKFSEIKNALKHVERNLSKAEPSASNLKTHRLAIAIIKELKQIEPKNSTNIIKIISAMEEASNLLEETAYTELSSKYFDIQALAIENFLNENKIERELSHLSETELNNLLNKDAVSQINNDTINSFNQTIISDTK